jgi:hypothetical protein
MNGSASIQHARYAAYAGVAGTCLESVKTGAGQSRSLHLAASWKPG